MCMSRIEYIDDIEDVIDNGKGYSSQMRDAMLKAIADADKAQSEDNWKRKQTKGRRDAN